MSSWVLEEQKGRAIRVQLNYILTCSLPECGKVEQLKMVRANLNIAGREYTLSCFLKDFSLLRYFPSGRSLICLAFSFVQRMKPIRKERMERFFSGHLKTFEGTSNWIFSNCPSTKKKKTHKRCYQGLSIIAEDWKMDFYKEWWWKAEGLKMYRAVFHLWFFYLRNYTNVYTSFDLFSVFGVFFFPLFLWQVMVKSIYCHTIALKSALLSYVLSDWFVFVIFTWHQPV